jgi:hypothetical protein
MLISSKTEEEEPKEPSKELELLRSIEGLAVFSLVFVLVEAMTLDDKTSGLRPLIVGDPLIIGEISDTLFVRRTPEGRQSNIPKEAAPRIKYCIVVPVLLVLFAFKALRVSFKIFGTNLHWLKWSNFISMTVL